MYRNKGGEEVVFVPYFCDFAHYRFEKKRDMKAAPILVYCVIMVIMLYHNNVA